MGAHFEDPEAVILGEGNVTITLDGKLVRKIEVTNENRRTASAEMHSIYIPLGVSGTMHKIVAGWHSSTGTATNIASSPHSVLEVHTYAQQRNYIETTSSLSPLQWVHISHDVGIARPAAKEDLSSWSLPVNITIWPNASDPRTGIAGESIMVEIPIPSTTSLS